MHYSQPLALLTIFFYPLAVTSKAIPKPNPSTYHITVPRAVPTSGIYLGPVGTGLSSLGFDFPHPTPATIDIGARATSIDFPAVTGLLPFDLD